MKDNKEYKHQTFGQWMMKNTDDLLSSLKKGDEGFSGAKISAFVVMFLICYCHFNYITEKSFPEILWTDIVFVLVLFGILRAERIIELFSKVKVIDTPEKPEKDETSNQA